jgi:hypothetical protein
MTTEVFNRLLTPGQAANMLGITSKALKMRANRGKMIHEKHDGQMFFKLRDVVDVIDSDADFSLPHAEYLADLISLPAAAKLLNMANQTLWARFNAGRNPLPTGKINGQWMFKKQEVQSERILLTEAGEFLKPLGKKPKSNFSREDVEYGLAHETITARCPYCATEHRLYAVKGSTKWQYCPKHVDLRNYSVSSFEPNRTILRTLEA